ncbi:MAG: dodecin [Desulfomonilia bacterium]|jgi:flavin-binding protein dodecin|uniref:Dodecin n=1 Tax=anaerobic digester metagenome TaxID=1263854 RepID=A0A485LY48_9ZZZZ|nr:dodecin family protein [Pseudomonadota bacterium]HON37605.1 dodecin family protein [Deltaproteobacteria bacterium]HRS55112.1 dodecin family protein [Desulfomonilia bacterium]HPD21463.1 dodecin family protein [Deltaproteobacteria bacterium]HPX19374.1 dodecin family protein [Deltaproteobacteria bacterium]
MDQVYKKLEVVGSSKNSVEEAINNALERTGESVRHMRWFEVSEIRGYIENGKVSYYQVALKIGFLVEQPA